MSAHDVRVVLHPVDGDEIQLSVTEERRLLEQFPAVAREAVKWRAMTGRPGTLIVIDEEVIAAYRSGEFSD